MSLINSHASFNIYLKVLNDDCDVQNNKGVLKLENVPGENTVTIDINLDSSVTKNIALQFKGTKISPLFTMGDRCLLLFREYNQSQAYSCRDGTPITGNAVKIDSLYKIGFSTKDERDRCLHFLLENTQSPNLDNCNNAKELSVFDQRTESTSAKQYFQFYALLSQQQNMLQDFVRTSTYQKAVHLNGIDFKDKVVLDVGAGSGILSYFAIQAGARKVYAVEASNMDEHCQKMANANNMAGRIIVVSGKIEEIQLPEPVDVIISEPMGYMLFNERMLESYIHARKFLRGSFTNHVVNGKGSHDAILHNGANKDDDSMKDGNAMDACTADNDYTQSLPKMFPSVAHLYVAPFTDEALFLETQGKANFWCQEHFHGVNLSSLRETAMKEYFAQPVVDTFDINICMAQAVSYPVDFRTATEEDLYKIRIPLRYQMYYSGMVHGLAFWFDVGFVGTQKTIWLSTGPTEQLTHWYQVRCIFPSPLFAQGGDEIEGICVLTCNERQSYDVYIELRIPGTNTKVCNTLDLKNPCFRYTGYPAQPLPTNEAKPPTELYYEKVTQQNQQAQIPTNFSNDVVLSAAPTYVSLDPDTITLPAYGAQNHSVFIPGSKVNCMGSNAPLNINQVNLIDTADNVPGLLSPSHRSLGGDSNPFSY